MIAHRLSTVKKADKIVVMNKGQIVEQGTHDELMFSQGAYYRLVSAQQLAVGPDMSNDNDENAETECEPEQTARAVSRKSKFASRRWSTWTVKPEIKAEDGSGKYNILRCLGIIFYEHKQHWLWFLGGLTGCFIAGAIFPAQAILFSKIVTVFSHYFSEKLRERGNFWALMFFILAIGTLIGYALLAYCWTSVAFLMARVYRSEYFSAIIRQDIEFFDIPENSSGSLTARLSSDPQSFQDLMQGNLGLIIVVLVNILSSSLLSLFTGWKLSLVAIFGCLPPLFLAGFTRMRLELSSQERVSKFFHESTRFAAEAVSAIRTVASLTLEDEVIHRYAERLNGPARSAYRRTLWIMILFGLSESVDLLGIGLAFWYGGRLMSFGEYDAEQFFLVFIAVVFGGQAAGMLFGFTANLTKAHAAANKIIHLRSVQPTINFSTGCDVPYAPYGCPIIEFKNVRFAYPTRPSASVLLHCSFQVYRGQKIGLVGSSGCGKSTIISLLERFYDITSGDILINGVSISALDVQKYRSTVALVSQEPTLYKGSIRENITLGIPYGEVSDEAVEKAARDANIHTFIQSLPQGYDTDVGTKGIALSGGQRQRLAIARALIRDPSILLLDEATSALDTESERIVQDAIEVASRGRTVLAVAHRLSTIRGYDRILVFESGRVVEEGSHEELVALRGRYWNMCLGQGMDREAA
ncbi:Similar to Leptomycin B resistance protein pmd1; acc. no. P36619 [Pyronema omphalodes CBS 100304]|uniref:Similar to Leptomycin B resistance protein pmd1 acc. no. P36619 n=1 Tax=Pyronema omphalodes (strain CBS 100304) TaxID=1076935 RepID=U4LG80_PYROM|nr:Similar to Leptomycin B resistance protein pmd1; acc. no. P36619 [Pyronema omphalodes CBS 100304]